MSSSLNIKRDYNVFGVLGGLRRAVGTRRRAVEFSQSGTSLLQRLTQVMVRSTANGVGAPQILWHHRSADHFSFEVRQDLCQHLLEVRSHSRGQQRASSRTDAASVLEEALSADRGYQGPNFQKVLAKILPHFKTEIVKRSDHAKGFVVLPRRWAVERTITWVNRCRRLVPDWENSTARRSRSYGSPQSA